MLVETKTELETRLQMNAHFTPYLQLYKVTLFQCFGQIGSHASALDWLNRSLILNPPILTTTDKN